jgi:ABC-type nitrate/sulfonate/bicarbonate transport systems, periplasmic components
MAIRLAAILVLLLSFPAFAGELAHVRIGLLKFGTVAWEVDVIKAHHLDEKNGIRLIPSEYATNEAAKVALLAGAVDLIVTDWPWVARQRAEGRLFSFTPYSKATGLLLVHPGSGVMELSDLKGKRIGVAGGPLDKSWLLLRAFSRQETGQDIGTFAEPVFGAPPLLSEEFAKHRIDAVLTYWHYAARLQIAGARPLLTVGDIMKGLGARPDVPILGYAFLGSWASENPEAFKGFLRTSTEAKALLARSNEEWDRLSPLLGTSDPNVGAMLKDGYRDGIINRWGDEERRDAARLYGVLAELGGEALVGRAHSLDPSTFWVLRDE